jgi:hypothetical protein
MGLALKILVPISGMPSWAAIVEEAIPQCKIRGGWKGERNYAKPSKINAIAAGKACTSRILRLTVTAP